MPMPRSLTEEIEVNVEKMNYKITNQWTFISSKSKKGILGVYVIR